MSWFDQGLSRLDKGSKDSKHIFHRFLFSMPEVNKEFSRSTWLCNVGLAFMVQNTKKLKLTFKLRAQQVALEANIFQGQ
jgi:hypothetical protein